jgi:hypothetical protein
MQLKRQYMNPKAEGYTVDALAIDGYNVMMERVEGSGTPLQYH